MLFTRIINVIDQRLTSDVFLNQLNIGFDEGLVNEGVTALATEIWWSWLTGVNIKILEDNAELFRVNMTHCPLFSTIGKRERETGAFAKALCIYTKTKTYELYRGLLRTCESEVVLKTKLFHGEEIQMFSIKDGIITKNEHIRVPLDMTTHTLATDIPDIQGVQISTRDFEESGEDIGMDRNLVPGLPMTDAEDVKKSIVALYNKVHDVLRTPGPMCLPKVWFVCKDAYIEYSPNIGFELLMFKDNELVTRLSHTARFTALEQGMSPWLSGIQAELGYATCYFLERQFEECARGIVDSFRRDINVTEGVCESAAWVIEDADKDSDSEEEEEDLNLLNIFADESDNESASDDGSDDGSEIISNVGDNDSGDESDNDSYDGIDEDSYKDDNYSSDIIDAKFDFLKTHKVIKMYNHGEREPFWQSDDNFAGPGFRTPSFPAIEAIVRQLETRGFQEICALSAIHTCERALFKKKSVHNGTIGVKINKTRVKIELNGRVVEKKLDGGLDSCTPDAIFDKILSKWEPMTSDECMVCQNTGGVRVSCCNNIIHAGCLGKWSAMCKKKSAETTCPMCRSNKYL